ncbi:MAG: hypothetical protein WC197_05885 [Candidatus Gastranaerophilaceae bacterium]|jgi:hypothetical protein
MDQILYNNHNQVIAQIRDESSNQRIYDASGRLLGRYEVSLDTTFDSSGSVIGKGNLLITLISL